MEDRSGIFDFTDAVERLAAENDCPLLAYLWPSRGQAVREVVEWPNGKNYTQIVRHPFGFDDTSDRTEIVREQFVKHLQSIELILWYGQPQGWGNGKTGQCGGVLSLLGREPREGDRLQLKLLRETSLLTNRQEVGSYHAIHEFLTEFSLVAERAPLLIPSGPPEHGA